MATSLPYSHVDSDLRVLAAQAEGSVAEPSVASMGPLLCLDSSGSNVLGVNCGHGHDLLFVWFPILSDFIGMPHRQFLKNKWITITIFGAHLKSIIDFHLFADDGPGLLEMNIKPKSKNIWIDCCSLCDYDDGLIDITRESTDSKLFLGVTLRSMIKRCSLEQILLMLVQMYSSNQSPLLFR
ncbi:hypothetical protein DKX38_010329 [Salix brachista]|uniref:Uncharacterized protein n=1 Tax=Salix brachista TaxID=2182728 RepID=A0A5N5MD81_9ROSI|nr:hypothetical protein DKX38_010329 [Salix brachista]